MMQQPPHNVGGAVAYQARHQPYTGLGITVETIGGELHGKPIGAFGVALHGLAGLGL